MSYATVTDGMIRTITSLSGFSCNNVFRNDSRHINRGQGVYVVIGFGGLQSEEIILGGIYDHNWTLGLDVYTRYTGEYKDTLNNADSNMQSLVDQIESDNTLSDTTGVHRVAVSLVGPIQPLEANSGRVSHVLQQIQVLVSEEP